MRAAPLIALAFALLLAGCSTQAPGATGPTDPAAGSGYAYGATAHHGPGTVTGPRAFVLNGAYAPGGKATLLTYVHGPVDNAWSLILRDGWHVGRDGPNWRINGTALEQRLAPQSFQTSPASVDLVVTGTLPDGHYVVSLLCVIDDHGRDAPCTSPAPLEFDLRGGAIASS